MRGRHRGFKPRNCWICGKEIKSLEEADFLPDDYNGVCKSHEILQQLIKKRISGSYYRNRYIIKTHNIMRKTIYTIFIAVFLWEIALKLPEIIDTLLRLLK